MTRHAYASPVKAQETEMLKSYMYIMHPLFLRIYYKMAIKNSNEALQFSTQDWVRWAWGGGGGGAEWLLLLFQWDLGPSYSSKWIILG